MEYSNPFHFFLMFQIEFTSAVIDSKCSKSYDDKIFYFYNILFIVDRKKRLR